jgi:hypothetical protein
MIGYAQRNGFHFGSDLSFTYGPLATLDQPSIFSQQLYWTGVLGNLVALSILATVGWLLARRFTGRVWAAVATVAILLVPIGTASLGTSGVLFVAAIGGAILLAETPHSTRLVALAGAAFALASAVALLAKWSYGVLTVATGSLALALALRPIWERLLLVLGTWIGTGAFTLLLWLAARQRIADLIPWVRDSLQLTDGYPSAMSIEAQDARYQWPLIVVFGVLAAILAAATTRGHRWRFFTILAFAGAAAIRLGFTRHDHGHTTVSFLLVALVLMGVSAPRWRALGLVAAFAATLAVIGASGSTTFQALANPVTGIRHSGSMLALLDESHRVQLLDEAQRDARMRYQLPPSMAQLLRTGSVHVDPQESALAWAYDLSWDPAPIFQMYSVYTRALDQKNADHLASVAGPDYIVRGLPSSIDSRYPLWDAPLTTLAMVCHYAPADEASQWLVLSRVTMRCGGESPLGTVAFAPGEQVAIPKSANPQNIVVARIQLKDEPLNEIASLVFKPYKHALSWGNGDDLRRIVTDHEGSPFVVRMAPSVGWPERFGGSAQTESLRFNEGGTISFSEIPVAAQ